MAVKMLVAVFWVVMLCGIWSMPVFQRNIATYLQVNAVSQPKRPISTLPLRVHSLLGLFCVICSNKVNM
jgi:hypothetical protein